MRLLRSIAAALLLALAFLAALPAQQAQQSPPRYGAMTWREPVATVDDLPDGTGAAFNRPGDCRLVQLEAERGIYCWLNGWFLMVGLPPAGGYGELDGDNTWTGSNQFGNLESGGGFTWEILGDGTDGTFKLGAGNAFGLDLDNTGAREFYADNAKIYSLLPFGIMRAATLPTCDSTLAPAGVSILAVDTTGPDLCLCSGSAWAPVDGSGTCA